MHAQPVPRSWTFADQISSYRFWALLGAWLCVAFNSHVLLTRSLQVARESLNVMEISLMMGLALPVGMVTGIIWGVLVVRAHTVHWLLVCVLLAGVLWPGVMASLDSSVLSLPVLTVNLILAKSLAYGFMLVVPVVLAAGRGGHLHLAAALAVALLCTACIDLGGGIAVMSLQQQWPQVEIQVWGIGAACVALLLLLPLLRPSVRSLFGAAPAQRHRPLPARDRHPLRPALWGVLLWLGTLAVLCLLVYPQWRLEPASAMQPVWLRLALLCVLLGLLGVVHWNYRIHGEIAGLAPSPELLTPKAAALAVLLLPLAALLLPLQLAAVLNQTQRTRIAVGWLVCWSLLMPAVAMAQIQRSVNRLAASDAG